MCCLRSATSFFTLPIQPLWFQYWLHGNPAAFLTHHNIHPYWRMLKMKLYVASRIHLAPPPEERHLSSHNCMIAKGAMKSSFDTTRVTVFQNDTTTPSGNTWTWGHKQGQIDVLHSKTSLAKCLAFDYVSTHDHMLAELVVGSSCDTEPLLYCKRTPTPLS